MMENAKQFAAEWMRDVLVELRDVPIHIVERRDRPDLWRPMGEPATATVLEQGELWSEDGFGMIVDFDRLPQPGHVTLRNLAAHEYVHDVLNRATEPVDVDLDVDPDFVPKLADVQSLFATVTSGVSPWFLHESDFVRLMCHIWYRSIVSGRRLCEWDVLAAGDHYGLSRVARYLASLGDEPERLIERPLVEVAMIEIPEATRELFARDCAAYRSKQ